MDSMAAAVQSFRSDELIFGIRPEDISCKEYEEKSSEHREPIQARVNVVETLGKETYLDLSSGQSPITAIVSPDISKSISSKRKRDRRFFSNRRKLLTDGY
jgi:ABC-type sugar transport system ATPase subunit